MTIIIEPIGIINTPYKQKFAIPRQPNLVSSARGTIHFSQAYNDPACLKGIEQFSHLWLLFQFHQTQQQGWSPLIRPPRLGGNQKVGVFASRSTFRPNGLGLSVVKNLGIRQAGNHCLLTVGGIDLLDQTPIIDIKPYLPYADALPTANGGYAQHKPEATLQVSFSATARQQLTELHAEIPEFAELIEQVLSQDPRPAYHQRSDQERLYGVQLYDYDVRWYVAEQQVIVKEILSVEAE